MKLNDEMPDLAKELIEGLIGINENLLAASVYELKITGRCTCDDESCGTFYSFDAGVAMDGIGHKLSPSFYLLSNKLHKLWRKEPY